MATSRGRSGRRATPAWAPVFLTPIAASARSALDLKQDTGRDVLLRLAKKLPTYWSTTYARRQWRGCASPMTMSAESIRVSSTPDYSASARTAPMRQSRRMTICCRAPSGLSHLLARAGDGKPRYVPTAMADRVVGLSSGRRDPREPAASRPHRGRGQRVDVPMFETMAGFVMGDHLGGLDLRAAARQGRLSQPHVAGSPTIPTQRRLDQCHRLQRQAVEELLRCHWTRGSARASALCDVRCPSEACR